MSVGAIWCVCPVFIGGFGTLNDIGNSSDCVGGSNMASPLGQESIEVTRWVMGAESKAKVYLSAQVMHWAGKVTFCLVKVGASCVQRLASSKYAAWDFPSAEMLLHRCRCGQAAFWELNSWSWSSLRTRSWSWFWGCYHIGLFYWDTE